VALDFQFEAVVAIRNTFVNGGVVAICYRSTTGGVYNSLIHNIFQKQFVSVKKVSNIELLGLTLNPAEDIFKCYSEEYSSSLQVP
jgi:hypothetical protein